MILVHRAMPFAALVLAFAALPLAAAERFSIVDQQFFQNGATASRPVLTIPTKAQAPARSGTAARAKPDLEAEMEAVQANLASLFTGRSGTSLFRELPRSVVASDAVKKLMQLIASAEAGKKQYDAVQYAATIKPPKRPTEMTIGEIYKWIEETPGQQHAIGRYQFIPATLRRLVKHVGASRSDRFSPLLQDRLAHQLLEEAGLSATMAGEMSRHDFMHNLSKIWAGLPTSSGKSYYHGFAGNKAVLSWARFDEEMARLFPG
jgi:muramidase (phage lysozyme)